MFSDADVSSVPICYMHFIFLYFVFAAEGLKRDSFSEHLTLIAEFT